MKITRRQLRSIIQESLPGIEGIGLEADIPKAQQPQLSGSKNDLLSGIIKLGKGAFDLITYPFLTKFQVQADLLQLTDPYAGEEEKKIITNKLNKDLKSYGHEVALGAGGAGAAKLASPAVKAFRGKLADHGAKQLISKGDELIDMCLKALRELDNYPLLTPANRAKVTEALKTLKDNIRFDYRRFKSGELRNLYVQIKKAMQGRDIDPRQVAKLNDKLDEINTVTFQVFEKFKELGIDDIY